MLQLISVGLKKASAEVIVVPVCEDEKLFSEKEIETLVQQAKKLKEFKGKKSETITLYNLPNVKAKRVHFFGMGKGSEVKPETYRSMAGNCVQQFIKKGFSEILIAIPSASNKIIEIPIVLESILEGACLGNHIFDKYKKEKKNKPIKSIGLLTTPAIAKQYRQLPGRIKIICEGTILARNWVSTPPNDKKPEQFARAIVTKAKKEKLKVRVLNEKELKKLKLNALLAVAEGSRSSARLVLMEYGPANAKKTVTLVGKGVTFDSGGINLKPSGSLEDMKMDMAGAAAVAATMITIARLGLKTKVIGVIPIVENMPSGTATRPGDIIKSYAGKTVEIGNTDAEGRLILIDAISFAIKRYKPDTIIDLATLAGACVMALGEKIAGIFSHDDDLANALISSGGKTYERCWRLPLPDDYKELIKSDLADIKNLASSRWGGAITAALFLSEFAEVSSWAHIDIAGPAYSKKGNAYCPKGGTGFGVRLLCEWMKTA
ncbi:MAG TPA: leucyl aminopeptidase [Desulfobacterales bacterium]|nr:leucyl aminopeptidase [Desulfobacterales bacterium]